MKKKSDKNLPTYDSARETRVLLEQMNKSIDTIAEQHGSIKQEISQLKGSIEQRFNRVEIVLTEHSKDTKELRGDIEELKGDTKELKTGQKVINQKLDTVTSDHEKRMQKLEEKVHA